MGDLAVQRSRRGGATASVTAAVVLGVLAFAADSVPGVGGQIMIALTSSGFAWGLAAVLAGRAAGTTRRAAGHATALLVLATLVYYGLVLLVSRRWSGGSLQDGTSADLQGLRSVAVMTTVWLVGSAIAGPVLGLLGRIVTTGGISTSAAAVGAICGLLSGQGWQTAFLAPPWIMPPSFDLHLSGFWPMSAGNLAQIVLPIAVLIWLATAHRLGRAWPVLLATAAAGTALCAALWAAFDIAQRSV
ncbi:hypothetical protein ACWKSP_30590 [Micromonosporaceae bacterium Da 78-11]